MMRESLDPGARHLLVDWLPQNVVETLWRTAGSGATSANWNTNVTTEPWVRLRRQGNVFTGFYSLDGIVWTQTTQQTIAMAGSIYAGLAVTAQGLDGQPVLDAILALGSQASEEDPLQVAELQLLGQTVLIGRFVRVGHCAGHRGQGHMFLPVFLARQGVIDDRVDGAEQGLHEFLGPGPLAGGKLAAAGPVEVAQGELLDRVVDDRQPREYAQHPLELRVAGPAAQPIVGEPFEVRPLI